MLLMFLVARQQQSAHFKIRRLEKRTARWTPTESANRNQAEHFYCVVYQIETPIWDN